MYAPKAHTPVETYVYTWERGWHIPDVAIALGGSNEFARAHPIRNRSLVLGKNATR